MKIGNLVSRLRIRRPRVRFKVRSRIAVVALLPLFGMTVFAGLFSYDQYEISRSAVRVQDLAERTPEISALIHELQRERGVAAGFLAVDGNSSARKPMETQHRATDAAIARFREVFDGFPFAAYGEMFRTDIEELTGYLDQIPATREAVSGLSMMHSGMNEFYTNTIGAAFDTIAAMSLISTNAELSRMITSYEALLEAKEKMGLERATGAAGFALGRFSPSAHQEFIRLGAAADNELAAFEALASQELMDLLFEFKVSPESLDVQRMRSAAIDSGYGREISDASLEEWFAATTAKIEMVRGIEQTVGGQLVDIAHAINTKASSNLYIAVAITAAFLVVNLFVAFLIARGVTRPLQRLNATMREIAEGGIECAVPDQGKHDEIGEMARSVEFFRSKLVENKELEAKQQRDAVRAEEEKRASMLKLAQEFEDSVGKLISGVGAATEQMKSSATAMTSIADEASQRSATVAAASEEASANVQTVATAAEEMSSSVQEISRQVSQSAQMAGNAVSQATETNDKVMGLADAAQKIGEVVEMISDIAAQTNLLALNATIEASRAGEAGKGFAVVATEVKSLATQTAKATEEIAAQIGAIQDETRSAVDAIQTITKAIGEISDVATAIASAVEEQGAATDEIATNVQQAASGTQDVSSNISEVSRGAQEAGSAAQQVLDAAGQLGQQTSELQSAVDTFLNTVRAA